MTIYRKMLPTEWVDYRDHLLRLGPEDRHARFTGTLGDEVIANHCRGIDWRRTLVVGCIERGVPRGAIEICTDRALWPNEAELALSLEPAWQERKLGTALMRRALTIASNRAVRRVHMMCLTTNRRMRALARRFGGTVAVDGGEAWISLDLPAPNQLSLALEAWEDGAAAVGGMIDQFQATPTQLGPTHLAA